MTPKKQDPIALIKPKKLENIRMYELAKEHLSEKMQELYRDCGSFNLFVSTLDKEKKKMIGGNHCKNRFCPICAWRKARKDAMALSVVMEAMHEEHDVKYLFLTLTTPNVRADEVKSEIINMNNAFQKLFKRRKVDRIIQGYARKLEMTYDGNALITTPLFDKKQAYYERLGLKVGDENPTYDTYNPHFHVVLAVKKSYFNNSKNYIKRDEWLEMWREVTGDYTITQVHIERIKEKQTGNAVAEIAKYSAKSNDMGVSLEVFETFYNSLKGKQVIAYSGLFKDYMLKYKANELEQYMEKDKNEYFYKIMANWRADQSDFVLEYVQLTELEMLKYNNKKVDEFEIE
ncbi:MULTISPECIES: protein rep [unclassified Exiguobacterium]|uniref:protein rep n=1 Tax=unclassified Exiguobacterium TaxID=2644629 RepID=UPI001BE5B0BA|nr:MULTISPECIES: protein rep [unclassified Exiguobacterium]